MDLEFKVWLERQFDPAMRDVRYGFNYGIGKRPVPSATHQIGSDIITGVGNLFRKRMGAGFPQYGTGVANYFDELSSVLTQDNQLVVVQYVEFKEGDDAKEAVVKALAHIQTKQEVQNAAAAYRLDLSKPTKVQHEIDAPNGALKVTFRYWINMRASQRFRYVPNTPPTP
jgi:hypothetical protein